MVEGMNNLAMGVDQATTDLIKPVIDDVLDAYKLLQSDVLALDFCGVDGRMRSLILGDPYYLRESKKIKAQKFAEEIKEINSIAERIKRVGSAAGNDDDNSRVSGGSGMDGKTEKSMIDLQMKAAMMRRSLLDLSTVNENDGDEMEALNVYFIPVTREEFEELKTIEIHQGGETSLMAEGEESNAPAAIRKTAERAIQGAQQTGSEVIEELKGDVLEYVNAEGQRCIEEI